MTRSQIERLIYLLAQASEELDLSGEMRDAIGRLLFELDELTR